MSAIAAVTGGSALAVARAALIVALVAAVVSPPLSTAASVAAVLAFLALPDWRARLRRTARSPLGLGVIALAAALAVAAVIGAFGPQGAGAAFKELLGWRTLLLVLVAAAVFDDERWQRYALMALVAVAALGAVATTVAAAVGWQYRYMPPGVLFRNTATQAIAFALGAYFCGALLALRGASLPRWQFAALAAALVLLLWRLVFYEVGRSGHVLLLTTLLVTAALRLRGRPRVVAMFGVPLAAALLFAASPLVRARFTLAAQEVATVAQAREFTSMGARVVMWRNGLELARARPLVGYGLGGTAAAYAPLVKDQTGDWRGVVTGDLHTQYLMLWVEAGVAGVLAFFAFLLGAWRQHAAEPWRSMGVAILAGWCVNSLFSSHFGTFSEGHLIALLLGVLLAVRAPPGRA